MEKFPSWESLLEHVRTMTGNAIWYQAPMNLHPSLIRVIRIFKERERSVCRHETVTSQQTQVT